MMQQYERKPTALPPAIIYLNGLAGETVPPDPVRGMIEATIGHVFNILLEDLGSTNWGPARVALARQVAMYLTHVACGLTLTDVGRLFARDRTTVAHACAVVEDLRDDAKFDRVLDLVEMIVRFQLQAREPRSAA